MRTFIIAEAGVNHNGSFENAKKLIDVAAKAGCDAVKFQTFTAKNLVTKNALKATYQIENTGTHESQYDMLKKLEIDYNTHIQLIAYCKEKDIQFLSSPFDVESADLLSDLGMSIFKIPSGEITNKPFLKYIAKKYRPIILSTGMSNLGDVEKALKWVYEEDNKEVTLLHCTSDYPTHPDDVNLHAMITMKQAFRVNVGYSDHTIGIEIPIAAVALGASIIEKHFTLDKNMEGPDHKASLEPHELNAMVSGIRNIELALGSGRKEPTKKELETRKIARKSIVTKVDIKKGQIICDSDLMITRPGTGIPPEYLDFIIGKKAIKDLNNEYLIQFEDFTF